MPNDTDRPGGRSQWGEPPQAPMGAPPRLDLNKVIQWTSGMFEEVTIVGHIPAQDAEALKRLFPGSARFFKGVTRAVINAHQEVGEGKAVEGLAAEFTEMEHVERVRSNHAVLHGRCTATLTARRDSLRRQTEPLVQSFLARAAEEERKDAPSSKVLDAANQLRQALAESEKTLKDNAKLREEGRLEGQDALEERDAQLSELRLHLDQKDKQVNFLQTRVAELEAKLAGLLPAAANGNRRPPAR